MLSRFHRLSAGLALSACLSAVPATAQENSAVENADTPEATTPELTAPSSVWFHEESTLRLPDTLDGFVRTKVNRFDDEGYNVGVSFVEETSGSWADVYVYRAGIPSVPMWTDRAASMMLSGGRLGNPVDGQLLVNTFTPPNGAGEDSGIRVAAGLDGEIKSTGLALYLHDGWLIKVRMSSRTLDHEEMDARVASFIGGVAIEDATEPAPPFAWIEDCEDKLKFRRARLIQFDMMGSLMVGTALGIAREKAAKNPPEQLWCRDAASEPQFGIYRNRGDDDSYTMAFGDGGVSLSVGKFDLGPLVTPSRGFLVTQSDGVTELVYPPFDRLPEPRMIAGLPGNFGPIVSFDVRPGADGQMTVHVQTETE